MSWDFDAGHLVLDFVNTLEWRNSHAPDESIRGLEDFLNWARQGKLLRDEEIKVIASDAKYDAKKTSSILYRVLEVRETLYRIFSNVVAGLMPADGDLEILNKAVADSMKKIKLEWGGDGFIWRWQSEKDRIERLIWLITQDAVNLLTGDLLDRIGECADDRGCGYLFIDTSKNRSRKWCSMDACGNRAKARKHYQRTKSEPPS